MSEWHVYPTEIPEDYGVYIVTLWKARTAIAIFAPATEFTSHSWRAITTGEEISKDYIVAWQKMPEPYTD